MDIRHMIKVGQYAYARELSNGEWSLYVGRWSDRALGNVTGLLVERDAGKPIRFASLRQAKEYTQFRAL